MKSSIATALVALVALTLPTAAEEPAENEESQQQTLLERVDDAMLGIRSHLQSARMKYRNGVIDGGDGSGHPATPMWECCRGNLTRIHSRSEELRDVVIELGYCYRDEPNHDGSSALGLFRMDHDQLDTGVEKLENASTRAAAEGVVGLMIQAYLQLQRSRDMLPPCPRNATDEAKVDKKADKKADKKKPGKPEGQ